MVEDGLCYAFDNYGVPINWLLVEIDLTVGGIIFDFVSGLTIFELLILRIFCLHESHYESNFLTSFLPQSTHFLKVFFKHISQISS